MALHAWWTRSVLVCCWASIASVIAEARRSWNVAMTSLEHHSVQIDGPATFCFVSCFPQAASQPTCWLSQVLTWRAAGRFLKREVIMLPPLVLKPLNEDDWWESYSRDWFTFAVSLISFFVQWPAHVTEVYPSRAWESLTFKGSSGPFRAHHSHRSDSHYFSFSGVSLPIFLSFLSPFLSSASIFCVSDPICS